MAVVPGLGFEEHPWWADEGGDVYEVLGCVCGTVPGTLCSAAKAVWCYGPGMPLGGKRLLTEGCTALLLLFTEPW